jgi:hypothetical protein
MIHVRDRGHVVNEVYALHRVANGIQVLDVRGPKVDVEAMPWGLAIEHYDLVPGIPQCVHDV